MLNVNRRTIWNFSVLMLIGALVACSPVQTPVPITTATIIASTATHTVTPEAPSASPLPSSTPIVFSTESSTTISTILESTIDLDINFTQAIIISLASSLDISANRIQVVSVEASTWDANTLACPNITSTFDGVTLSSIDAGNQVEGLGYILLIGDTLYEYHTEGTARFVRCEGQSIMSGEVLVAVDPLAAETLRVVQNLLATELDLSSRLIQLVDMSPVTWTDTSLGCPQPDQTYTETDIQGYHIVVTVGDELYVYHSDSNTAYPCPIEQSVIPAN